MEAFAPGDYFRFPDESGAIELRAFTHGLQPVTVPAMMEQFTEDWRQLGVDAWNEVPNHWRPESGDTASWWTLPTYLGDEFIAPLLGASPGTCILQPHVHWSIQCILSTPEVQARGREIVIPETAFPSLLHSVQRWESLQDVQPTIVPSTAQHRVDLEGVLQTIGDDTALVGLSHVAFTTGARLRDEDLQRVAEKAHAHDSLFVLDGYHAAGTMPIDVRALGCDLYVGGPLKEGCGSSGNAFLYVREDLELTPRLTGWFGDAAPFAFRSEPEPHPDVRRRFLGGTTAVAPMYHAVEGVRILLDCGLETVRAHSLELTSLAIERADAAGLPLRSPRHPDARGAIVVLEVPDAHKLSAYLKTHDIYTDSRRNALLRMAPFLWNTADDVHRTFDRIETGLRSGDYESVSLSSPGPVT